MRADGMCLPGAGVCARVQAWGLCTPHRYLLYQQQSLLHGPVPLGSAIPAEAHTVCYIAGFWTVHLLPLGLYNREEEFLISEWVQVCAVWSSQGTRHCSPWLSGGAVPHSRPADDLPSCAGRKAKGHALPLPQHLVHQVSPKPFDVLQPRGQRCWTCHY